MWLTTPSSILIVVFVVIVLIFVVFIFIIVSRVAIPLIDAVRADLQAKQSLCALSLLVDIANEHLVFL